MARLHPELPFPEPSEVVCHHDKAGHKVIAVSDYAAAKAAGWKLTKGVTADDQRRAEHEVSNEGQGRRTGGSRAHPGGEGCRRQRGRRRGEVRRRGEGRGRKDRGR